MHSKRSTKYCNNVLPYINPLHRIISTNKSAISFILIYFYSEFFNLFHLLFTDEKISKSKNTCTANVKYCRIRFVFSIFKLNFFFCLSQFYFTFQDMNGSSRLIHLYFMLQVSSSTSSSLCYLCVLLNNHSSFLYSHCHITKKFVWILILVLHVSTRN